MVKKLTLILLCLIVTISVFADVVKVPHPQDLSKLIEGKPRPAAVVAQEKKMALEGMQAAIDYIKKNGQEAFTTEFHKDDAGIFAKYYPKVKFYWAVGELKGPYLSYSFAYNVEGFRGLEMDVEGFPDLTGFQHWKALIDTGRKTQKTVEVQVLWQEPDWANGKKVRVQFYYTPFEFKGKDYFVYRAFFLDE